MLVSLTAVSPHEEIFVNTDHIIDMERSGPDTKIFLSDGRTRTVDCLPAQVAAHIHLVMHRSHVGNAVVAATHAAKLVR